MIEGIIFDFDGVIVKSNKVRRQTYFDIFPECSCRNEIVATALKSSGIKTRWGLIESILEKLKGAEVLDFEDLEIEKKKYVEEYSRVTEEKVSEVDEVEGAEKSLKELSEKRDLFIVSGTTQESLDIVVNNRVLGDYFKKVCGTAQGKRSKVEIINELLGEFNLNPSEIVYVGDGIEDLETAKFFGMKFIGVASEGDGFGDIELDCKLIDLEGLSEVISDLD